MGTSTAGSTGVGVRLDAVAKVFESDEGQVRALDTTDLELDPGAFVSVVGASGCGKTTLMRLVAGLVAPTSGGVTVDGNPVEGPLTTAGIVFQSDLLLDWRTALDNVLLQVEMRGIKKAAHRERAVELLRRVGLSDFLHHYPPQLSGGMRQRAAICRALLLDFPLLLMDEPFGALDALTRDQLNLDLESLLEHRPTVLFITHSIEEAVFLSDHVVVMTPRPGRIGHILRVDLPRPRTLALRDDPKFDEYTSQIRKVFLEQGVLHETS